MNHFAPPPGSAASPIALRKAAVQYGSAVQCLEEALSSSPSALRAAIASEKLASCWAARDVCAESDEIETAGAEHRRVVEVRSRIWYARRERGEECVDRNLRGATTGSAGRRRGRIHRGVGALKGEGEKVRQKTQ